VIKANMMTEVSSGICTASYHV